MIYIFIFIALLLVVSCIVTYHEAKINVLHDVRAAFEKYEEAHHIVKKLDAETKTKEDAYDNGVHDGIVIAEEIVEEMTEIFDLIDFKKKNKEE